jgi:hypothetical protein
MMHFLIQDVVFVLVEFVSFLLRDRLKLIRAVLILGMAVVYYGSRCFHERYFRTFWMWNESTA